jgi:hypothetical protein
MRPRYILFEWYAMGHGPESNAKGIWRIEPDGSNPVQLTSGNFDHASACSPDAARVFYIDGDSNQIKDVPVEGGTPEIVSESPVPGATLAYHYLGIAPDGKTLAVAATALGKVRHAEPQSKIALIPLEAGPKPPVRLVDPDSRISGDPIFIEGGNTLLYAIAENGVDNLLAQPKKGGPGRQITSFSSDRIGYYHLSPDGKSVFLWRYHSDSDVVLLRDTAAH